MKKIISLLLVAITLQLAAQEKTDTLKMSLQQCIEYALKNNVNVKNATLDEEIAAAKVREVTGIGLPQINGSAGLQHYFKLRNSYFGSNTPFSPKDAQGNPILSSDAIIIYPNIFQLPSTLDANITASQILFNASYLVGLQAAKTFKELSQRATIVTKQQTANNVKKAYYQQLIGYERIKLFDVSIVRLDSTIRQMKKMQSNGFVEKIDVDRLEVNYNNLLTDYEKTLNMLILSSLALKFQMSMPLEQNLLLSDNLQKFTSDTSFKSNDQTDANSRPEYQLLLTQRKANKLELKNNRAAGLPSLMLSGTLGAFSSVNNMDFFKNKPFFIYDAGNPQNSKTINQSTYWSDYSFIQAGINVPIFSGFQRGSRVQQSKLNLQKTENNIKNFEQTIGLQVQSAKVNLMNSRRAFQIQQRNIDLAKNVNSVVSKKYKAGIATNLEVTDSESSLKEAQINYFNALYDFLVSKTDYEQAAGLITY